MAPYREGLDRLKIHKAHMAPTVQSGTNRAVYKAQEDVGHMSQPFLQQVALHIEHSWVAL